MRKLQDAEKQAAPDKNWNLMSWLRDGITIRAQPLAGFAISTAFCAETFDLQKMALHLRFEIALDVF